MTRSLLVFFLFVTPAFSTSIYDPVACQKTVRRAERLVDRLLNEVFGQLQHAESWDDFYFMRQAMHSCEENPRRLPEFLSRWPRLPDGTAQKRVMGFFGDPKIMTRDDLAARFEIARTQAYLSEVQNDFLRIYFQNGEPPNVPTNSLDERVVLWGVIHYFPERYFITVLLDDFAQIVLGYSDATSSSTTSTAGARTAI